MVGTDRWVAFGGHTFLAISVVGQNVVVGVHKVGLTRDLCEFSASHSLCSCHQACG